MPKHSVSRKKRSSSRLSKSRSRSASRSRKGGAVKKAGAKKAGAKKAGAKKAGAKTTSKTAVRSMSNEDNDKRCKQYDGKSKDCRSNRCWYDYNTEKCTGLRKKDEM